MFGICFDTDAQQKKFMILTPDCLVVARSTLCVLLFSTDWRSEYVDHGEITMQ